MFNNFFRVYVIETKLDFVSFDDKNLQRRRKIGERDFPRQTSSDRSGSMSESQQGLEICHVISVKHYSVSLFQAPR